MSGGSSEIGGTANSSFNSALAPAMVRFSKFVIVIEVMGVRRNNSMR